MARGINKVILVGHLGCDPETRAMPVGGAVTLIRLGTTVIRKSNQQEFTEWHRVVLRDHLADLAQQNLQKGSRAYVEGSLRSRKWQTQGGADRYITEVVASDLITLDNSRPVDPSLAFRPSADDERWRKIEEEGLPSWLIYPGKAAP